MTSTMQRRPGGRTTLAVLAALAALGASTGAFAHEEEERGRDHGARTARAETPPLMVVPNTAAPSEPAHGWRYFSDAGRRAVVISPEGTYYLSRGKGLRPVAGTGPSA